MARTLTKRVASKKTEGIGLCNSITITDNAIIPLKERVVDRFFDPLGALFRVFRP
jgi:succinate dehydrogenase / fumarate reductase iron-sulfur subunit